MEQKLNEAQNKVYECLAETGDLDGEETVLKHDYCDSSLVVQFDIVTCINNVAKVLEIAAYHGFICLVIESSGGKQPRVIYK